MCIYSCVMIITQSDFVLQLEVDFVGQYGFIRNFPPNSNFSAFSFDIPSARIDKCFF